MGAPGLKGTLRLPLPNIRPLRSPQNQLTPFPPPLGPKANSAALPLPSTGTSIISIHELFIRLFQAAVETSGSAHPVRFLSRYDKSANNIKESAIWAAIGQTPWSHPYSTWYHKYVEFPFQALRAASELGEYTLTDQGTWWAIEGEVRERMVVFVSVSSSR